MLIGVAISGDRNVIKKEAEKILKYKEILIEIQRTWNVKAEVILTYLITSSPTYLIIYLLIYLLPYLLTFACLLAYLLPCLLLIYLLYVPPLM